MRKTIPTLGVVSAGLMLAGSPAHAVDTNMSSNLNVGIANGIQAHLPIQAPINICGNGIALLGSASGNCVGGATANYATGRQAGSSGNSNMNSALNVGIANGIQADALVQVPVNVCGNAIALLGTASASCTGGATANAFTGDHRMHPPMHPYGMPGRPGLIAPLATAHKLLPAVHKAGMVHSGPARTIAKPHKKEAGLLAGLLSPVTGLLGHKAEPKHGYGMGGGNDGGPCGNVSMSTFGNVGIANGIQVHAPIQVPINFSGNAIGILGSATASSTGSATANYCTH
jgi:hypothetical protein